MLEEREGIYEFDPDVDLGSDAIFKLHYGKQVYKIGNFGQLGYIAGVKESRKSTFARSICASALCNRPVMGYHFDVQGRNVLYFDTEMPHDLFQDGMKRMMVQAGLKEKPKNFRAISAVGIEDPDDKKMELLQAIYETGDLGLVIIDLLTDTIYDENQTESCNLLINFLSSEAKKRDTTFISLSHLKDDGTKLYGMLGRKLDKKSSFGFKLVKKGTTTFVGKEKCRYGEFPTTSFDFDEFGIPKEDKYIPFHIKI